MPVNVKKIEVLNRTRYGSGRTTRRQKRGSLTSGPHLHAPGTLAPPPLVLIGVATFVLSCLYFLRFYCNEIFGSNLATMLFRMELYKA